MQFVGGAIIFVFWIVWYNVSANAPFNSRGFRLGETLAALQISSANCGDTRQKSLARKPDSEWLLVSCNILRNTPNSIPYGCGLISLG